jgi:trans-aconitate methyltransferase
VNARDAADLIASAVGDSGGVWADMGAGAGTFTRALITLLRPGSRIHAVDLDPAAVGALRKLGNSVNAIQGDFSKPPSLPAFDASLDGMLFANALHFVPDPEIVLEQLVKRLKPGGRLVIVEYDRRAANPWVPYPIESDRWQQLASDAGLENPLVTARRKSEYAGELYAAVAVRPA